MEEFLNVTVYCCFMLTFETTTTLSRDTTDTHVRNECSDITTSSKCAARHVGTSAVSTLL